MVISNLNFRWLYLSLSIFSMSMMSLVADEDFDSSDNDYNEEIALDDPEAPPADFIHEIDGCEKENSDPVDPHHPPRFMTDRLNANCQVKLSGKYLFIAGLNSHAVSVYRLNDNNQWILMQTIDQSILPDLGINDRLNFNVNVKGDWLFVTGIKKAVNENVNTTHVFKLNRINETWQLSQTLMSP